MNVLSEIHPEKASTFSPTKSELPSVLFSSGIFVHSFRKLCSPLGNAMTGAHLLIPRRPKKWNVIIVSPIFFPFLFILIASTSVESNLFPSQDHLVFASPSASQVVLQLLLRMIVSNVLGVITDVIKLKHVKTV